MSAALAEDVAAVRAFNRFYTRRIGALDEAHLDAGFSLGEARVLYELGQVEGLTAKRLCEVLGLDGGYLSRILGRFEASGLIERRPHLTDGRSTSLHLTSTGREAYATLDARSQAWIGELLSPLDEEGRGRLSAALRSVRGLLEGGGLADQVTLRRQRPGDMGWIVERHGALYAAEHGWGPRFEALVGRVCADFLQDFDAERERCWIAERDGVRLGCVFLTRGDEPALAKLRMLLVEPAARRLGLGARLVGECVAFARERGYGELRLWTQSVLEPARRIYAAKGFRLAAAEPHALWGVPLTGETWSLKL
jgi:DNA-binding MarR family transcriptional regulator/N-acetylglutamate synthase-like GNAT family acetyltransferase